MINDEKGYDIPDCAWFRKGAAGDNHERSN